MRGIYYNSKKALCSIWESGMMCYNALKNSEKFTLDYSEDTILDDSYDFVIINYHHAVNKWITEEEIRNFNKPSFCIVTEVTFQSSPINMSPSYFDHYIVLDSSVKETNQIHPFGRPLENYNQIHENTDGDNIPIIGSCGFATPGKDWNKIIECVQNEFDDAIIRFNIPKGDYVPIPTHIESLNNIIDYFKSTVIKPGIKLEITCDNLSKEELVMFCKKNTINCFFYFREHIFNAGLAAATDQAISAGKPLLVTNDCTFRHIHKYIDYYPNISMKEAIDKTVIGVNKMKEDWSCANFLKKFEQLL